jgi:hypothetical protein
MKEVLFLKFAQFVQDLNEVFGQKTKSIKMYNIVLQKLIELKNEGKDISDRIFPHTSVLEAFLRANKDAIMAQDASLIVSKQIKYSDSIYIDIDMVIHHSEEKTAIWKHLLLLESLTDPESNAKNILNKLIKEDTHEAKLIKNLASKLESPEIMEKLGGQNISANPFEMMQTLTSSGLMDSIMGGMTGDINKVNPKKLLGTMKNMLDMISSQMEDGEDDDTKEITE